MSNTPLMVTVDRQTVKRIRQAIGASLDNLSLANRYWVLLRAADTIVEQARDNTDDLLTLIDLFNEKVELEAISTNLKETHKILNVILATTDECLPKGSRPGETPGAFGTIYQNNQFNQREKPSNTLLSVVSTNWKPSKFHIGQCVHKSEIDKFGGGMGEIRGARYNLLEDRWIYAVKFDSQKEEDFAEEFVYCNEEELMDVRDFEDRVKRHAALLQAIAQSGCVCVTLHALDESLGFPYLEVIAPLPERLNKPREQVLGQSCLSVDPRIGEPRFHALKKAAASGLCENYQYTYDDEFHWKFNVTVAPLYGREELISIVSDAESWQLGHWLNKLK